MKLLVLYEKTLLLIDRTKKELEQSKTKKDKVPVLFETLKLYIFEGIRILIRFLCLLFGDSAENFLIFSKLGKDSINVCDRSFHKHNKTLLQVHKQY